MGTWIQPVLTANGTIGQDDFAVSTGGGADSNAYSAFDSSVSSYVNKINADAWLMFYVKATIQINSIALYSDDGYLPKAGILQVSYDEGNTWTQVGSWQDTEGTSYSATVVVDTPNVQGNYWRLLSQGVSLAHPRNNADFTDITIDADIISLPLNASFDAAREIKNDPLLWRLLKVWLRFNSSTTADLCGNTWTATGSPTISTTNAFDGKALQLDGSSYLRMSEAFEFTGQAFTIGCWFSGTGNTSGGTNCLWEIYKTSSNRILLGFDSAGILEFWNENTKQGVYSSANVLGGYLHYAETVFDGTTWYLFLDGSLIGTMNYTPAATNYTLSLGVNTYSGRKFTGTIDEFQVYDGTALHTVNFTPPTTDDYNALERGLTGTLQANFTADVERKVQNVVAVNATFDAERKVYNNWRYVNAGTADSLTVSGATLTDLPLTKSVTGSAFYQTTRAKCFDIPATSEIWIKFDVYFDGTNRWRVYNDNSAGRGNIDGISAQKTSTSTGILSFFANSNSSIYQTDSVSKKNQLQTVLLHMVTGSSGGIVEAWLDGVKLYTYTGNVNNGEDFADIYLQSNGSGTFFSNVIISNGEISLQDGFKNFSVDTERLLRESQFALVLSASVERRLKNVVSVLCDVTRNVYKPWKYYNPGTADDLLVEGTTVTDLPESKSVTGTAFYQTQRVKCFDIPPSDDIWIKFDAYIEWLYFVGFYFVGNYPPSIPDVPRVSNGIMLDRHPTKSKLVLKFWGYEGSGVLGWADVLSTDTLQTFLLHLKSGRNDGVIEAWVDGELAGRYTGNVNYGKPLNDIAMIGYGGDLLSNVVISNVRIGFEEGFHRFKGFETERTVVNLQRFYFDTLRKIPHKVFVAPLDPLINETTGVQSIQIELAAQQLTDRVTYTSINPADIMQQIRGSYLDYVFDMRVEEISQNGALYTCQLCSDLDQLLYTQFNYYVDPNYHVIYRADMKNRMLEQMNPGWTASETEDTEIRKATAKYHLYHFGDVLNIKKQGVIRFDDFVSDMDVEQKNVTYADLISNLFGWTARLPQMMIHCYFRGDKIYVIQRGHEDNEIDITNLKHTAPTVNRKIMRTTWGSSPDEEYSLEKINPGLFLRPPPPEVSEDGKTFYTYKRINPHGYLLTGTRTQNDDGSVVEVTYSYTLSTPYNLTEERSVTRDSSGKISDEHTVQHNYLTPSQTHSVWYEDGNNEGSVIGSHVAGFYDEVITLRETTTDTKTFTIYGNPLIDTSFPVVNQDKLAELSAAIRWLNRKTQETISLDIYDFPHVIDFNDRIIFNGNTYFLESNSVTRTPRIVNKQSISFVRWY